MRAQDLYENRESRDMAYRTWRRAILSGRINKFPDIFRRCLFEANFVTNNVMVTVDTPMLSIPFSVSLNSLTFIEYFIGAHDAVSISDITYFIEDEFGVNLTDIRSGNDDEYLNYDFASEQFKTWITEQVKPWSWFMTFDDNNQRVRVNWLRNRGGSTITKEDLSLLKVKW